jgi:hypothetical protein
MGKANIDYKKYLSLLQEAAINYDNALKTKPRQTVYEHCSIYEDAWDPYAYPEYEVNFHEMGSDDSFQCDVDTPVGVLEAYAHERTIRAAYKQQQHMAGSRMHWEAWHSLSPEAQKIWDQLSEKDKAVILGSAKPPDRGYRSAPKPPPRRVNFYEYDHHGDEHEEFADAQEELEEQDTGSP